METEPSSPTPQRVDLAEVTTKYLDALQRIFDVINFSHAASRLISEEEFENYTRSHRAMPNYRKRLSFEEAATEHERWIVRHSLGEGLGLMIFFLEDARTLASLLDWKAEGGNPETVSTIVGRDRREFLAKTFEEKLDFIESALGIGTDLTPAIRSLQRIRLALLNRDGRIQEKDIPSGSEALHLVIKEFQRIELPRDKEAALAALKEGRDVEKIFRVGDPVDLTRTEHLSAIVTLSFFVASIAQAIGEKARLLGDTSGPAPTGGAPA